MVCQGVSLPTVRRHIDSGEQSPPRNRNPTSTRTTSRTRSLSFLACPKTFTPTSPRRNGKIERSSRSNRFSRRCRRRSATNPTTTPTSPVRSLAG